MGADNQAESVPERKRLSAIAKIKQDLAWRSVAGVLSEHIVLTRQQAEELEQIPVEFTHNLRA
jgi:hypothetical protein